MKIVAYYRVSTERQGRSGLGLEAQKADVDAFSARTGGQRIAEFTEVESGKRADRPELGRALELAKSQRATLVVAKIDRLARNVAFLSTLMRAGVEFLACDNPHATKLTVHILAAVAEDEAERISARVKAALAAYKARGGLLGAADPRCRRMTNEMRRQGSAAARQANRLLAREFREAMRPILAAMRSQGKTLRQMAEALNSGGYATRRGRSWTVATVEAVLSRRLEEKWRNLDRPPLDPHNIPGPGRGRIEASRPISSPRPGLFLPPPLPTCTDASPRGKVPRLAL